MNIKRNYSMLTVIYHSHSHSKFIEYSRQHTNQVNKMFWSYFKPPVFLWVLLVKFLFICHKKIESKAKTFENAHDFSIKNSRNWEKNLDPIKINSRCAVISIMKKIIFMMKMKRKNGGRSVCVRKILALRCSNICLVSVYDCNKKNLKKTSNRWHVGFFKSRVRRVWHFFVFVFDKN